MRSLALVLVAAGWMSGCKRPVAPHVDAIEVRVHVLGPDELKVPEQAELKKMVEAAIAASPGPLRYEPTGAPSTKLVVSVELGWQQGSLRSQSRAALEPRGEDAGTTHIAREALLEKGNAEKLPTLDEVRNHLRRAFALTAGAAVASEQLWLGPPEAARAAITGKDLDLRLDAMAFAGARHDREAVPALIEALKSEDEAQRDRAIGALAELGDPRAVHPLTALAKLNDDDELPKIIDSVARIGGTEATDYLALLAEAHPNPDIKDMAKRALEHLRERAKPHGQTLGEPPLL
ncbi:MAG: HEAT repeat domain-containing protein [Polyangia bacterium]